MMTFTFLYTSLCMRPPDGTIIDPHGHHLNERGRGSLDGAKYIIPMLYAELCQKRRL